MKKLLLFLLFPLTLLSFDAAATHVMGAEIEWEAIGKDSFIIKMSVYRDCNGIQLSTTPITVSTNCGTLRLNPTSTLVGDVTPVCSTVSTRCVSRGTTFKYGIQKFEFRALYVATNHIKNGCCEATISWSQCCRNNAVTTGGASQNFYIDAKMNTCLGKSSPKWSESAIGIGCLGRDQLLDNSVKTTDSVVYRITDPLQTATTKTSWSSPYSSTQPIYYLGFPKTGQPFPRGFHLDPSSGELKFRPMKEEQTVIATEVEIYHKGKKVGSMKRDMQFIVIKCPNNNPPTLSGIDVSNPIPQNFTTTVCAGKKLCFTVKASDKDTTDTVRLSYNGGIPGATFSITNPGAALEEGEFCWTPSLSDISRLPHRFVVSAKDNACPTPGFAARSYSIIVRQPYQLDLDLQVVADKCGKYRLKVTDKNGANINDVRWFENDSIYIGQGDSLLHTFTSTGNRKITATVDDCINQSKDTIINVPAINTLNISLDDEVICHNEALRLEPTVTGGVGRLSYDWDIDSRLGYTGSTNNSRVDLSFNNSSGPVVYNFAVIVEDTVGCTDTAIATVFSKNNRPINLESDRTICEGSASPIALNLSNGQGNWSGTGVSNNNLDLSGLSPGTAYLLSYKFEDSLSCLSDSVLIDYRAVPQLNIGTDFNSCTSAPQAVQLNTPAAGGTWSGTGVSGNVFDPSVAGQGNFYLHYAYTDSFGCDFRDSIKATVFNYQPVVTVSDSVKACSNGSSALISGQPSGGAWLGPGIASTTSTISVDPKQLGSGDYTYVYAYVDSNSCSNSDSTVLRVHQAPIVGFQIIDTISYVGDTVRINNQTIGSGHEDYTWKIGDPVYLFSKTFDFKQPIDSTDTFDVLLIARDTLTGCSDSFRVKDGIIIRLNTSAPYFIKGMEIYPNPMSGVLNIKTTELGTMNIRIVSTSGKEVYQGQVPGGSAMIQTEHLETGLYLLQMTQNGQMHTQLLMKD